MSEVNQLLFLCMDGLFEMKFFLLSSLFSPMIDPLGVENCDFEKQGGRVRSLIQLMFESLGLSRYTVQTSIFCRVQSKVKTVK